MPHRPARQQVGWRGSGWCWDRGDAVLAVRALDSMEQQQPLPLDLSQRLMGQSISGTR
eukprot:CAMPEP_0202872658 /NCGR_PEP_ID=MMETSP1391-20130828/21731_1 /ASSEMBLY_ACC=CAM_ASM_000867 /TAXON_ID=1034604 /ORGANISM="Chlamydomonas leiostraca, Strain SAG 11-49" /LENGTH=57 /DNA_ID=CAMNT_0049553757 /DNA_START=108 /DNA_END=281 /DNA_ORIENTATION=-